MNSEVKYDQHFMVDEKLLNTIASHCNTNEVIEIGPGKGALTKYLLKKATVTAIELDEFMIHQLQKTFSKEYNSGKLTIINANALNQHYDKMVFSNLPYAISEPFFYKLLKEQTNDIVLVTGELFYKRLQGNEKLGIIAKHCFEMTKIADVPRESFNPMPKVKSTCFSLHKKKEDFFTQLFSQWDKKSKNAVIESLCFFGKTKREAKELIKNYMFPDKKLINLSNDEFIVFYESIEKLEKPL